MKKNIISVLKGSTLFLLLVIVLLSMPSFLTGTASAADITITYDLNGGTVSPYDSSKTVKVSMSSGGYTTIKSSSYYYPGKSIIGWSTSRGGSIKYYPGQVGVQFKSSTTLYAVWGNPDCKITYNPNVGGTVKNGPDKQSFKAGTLVKIAPPDMVKDGCTLLGFSTSKTSTKVDYKKGDSVRLYYSTTLYAVWRGTITYNAGIGGSVQQGPTQQTFITGTSVTLSPPNMYKKGYTLLGYSTNKNATKADYFSGKKYTFNNCVTLYAIWLPIYSVEVYSSKTATTPDKTYSIDSGTKLSSVINNYSSKKEGYHYEWYTKDGKSVNGDTKVTSHLKIYPTDALNTATIKVYKDGSLLTVYIKSFQKLGDVIKESDVQKNGYIFIGFYSDRDKKTAFTMLSTEITVPKNGITITLYPDYIKKGESGEFTVPIDLAKAEGLYRIINKEARISDIKSNIDCAFSAIMGSVLTFKGMSSSNQWITRLDVSTNILSIIYTINCDPDEVHSLKGASEALKDILSKKDAPSKLDVIFTLKCPSDAKDSSSLLLVDINLPEDK